jgi:nucleotide-binding universal stress UspA family protein
MFDKLLVANDGSQGGERAFQCALELAKRLGVALEMICVEELPRRPARIDEVEETQADASRLLETVAMNAYIEAKSQGVVLKTHVVAGHPVPAIAEFAERGGYDLLVVGFMGHSALYNRMIGSTTDRLVEIAPCQVMVAK